MIPLCSSWTSWLGREYKLAKDGLGKYSAADSALGYLYQVRLALLWSLRRAKTSDFIVAIETIDDVSFSTDGDPSVVLQTKHSVHHVAGLSDGSPELWKTLRIWVEGFCSGEVPEGTARFLVSTSVPPANGACANLGVDSRNVEVAADLLHASASTSSNKDLQDSFEAFTSLTKTERANFLGTVYVVGNQSTAVELSDELRSELYWMVPKDFLDKALARLEGWWFRRAVHGLSQQASARGIAKAEIEAEIYEIQEEFKRDALPIDDEFEQLTVALESLPEFADRPLYAQLKLIGVGTERIRHAITSYLRAFGQRSQWVRDELLFVGEISKYEHRLVDEWSLRFAQICDELGVSAAEDEMKKAGHAVLKWAEDINIPIRPNVNAPWVCRGSLQMLADDRRVGWHPQFEERLKELLKVPVVNQKGGHVPVD